MDDVIKVSRIDRLTEELLRMKYGEDFEYEEGDEFFFAFRDCTVRTYMKDGERCITISGSETIQINTDLNYFTNE